ncbi:hypothetical protein [Streptomyces anulatus]|uniref:hypothetical protein n=1 Tax=Streptomyces anulatus TaxID=1892 RepID=UPI0033E31750
MARFRTGRVEDCIGEDGQRLRVAAAPGGHDGAQDRVGGGTAVAGEPAGVAEGGGAIPGAEPVGRRGKRVLGVKLPLQIRRYVQEVKA